ncbi:MULTISPECIES: aspartyl-phosphate phosphatase Spo0E family protein [Paenibacillus]|nr:MULTISPECIES: aspartyl-phosphate phosphatase Spo0E family protein [Paenibacillus]MCZ1267698.1 aspartyl-phosphate phosphatase Spo0E family protein [Paenibacillus tundrae]SEB27639.1 Spo0E like sporulation regulatory protein [Paenibacillus sp. 276b]SLK16141.1 Spo0E like sporulation regulatory protein [Paenibacillus sp. RU5A]SOC74220.1 Spo0E like sporulation regulatory protein [Paenibacillus sp. RU26A]SOC76370.1 Spo0E like sporulation regulatory protein [Paenibacillus sp. RU5M]
MDIRCNVRECLERERNYLYQLVDTYGLLHPVVVKQSQILDEIINIYNKETEN